MDSEEIANNIIHLFIDRYTKKAMQKRCPKRQKMLDESDSVEEEITKCGVKIIFPERELRPIGEFTVSSLDKEFIELLDCLKQERINDIELLLKCSKDLRETVNSHLYFYSIFFLKCSKQILNLHLLGRLKT